MNKCLDVLHFYTFSAQRGDTIKRLGIFSCSQTSEAKTKKHRLSWVLIVLLAGSQTIQAQSLLTQQGSFSLDQARIKEDPLCHKLPQIERSCAQLHEVLAKQSSQLPAYVTSDAPELKALQRTRMQLAWCYKSQLDKLWGAFSASLSESEITEMKMRILTGLELLLLNNAGDPELDQYVRQSAARVFKLSPQVEPQNALLLAPLRARPDTKKSSKTSSLETNLPLLLSLSTQADYLSQVKYIDSEASELWEHAVIGSVKNADKKTSFWYVSQDQHQYLAIIAPGRAEAPELYKELIMDLHRNGIDSLLIGFSGQTGDPGVKQGDIARFDEYVDGFNHVLDDISNITLHKNYKKKVLIAHSMGGAIATLALSKANTGIDHLFLVTPMLGLNLPDWQLVALNALNKLSNVIGELPSWLGGGAIIEKRVGDRDDYYADNSYTQSPARYAEMVTLRDKYKQQPPTYRWVIEAISGADRAQLAAEQLSLPTTIYLATQDAVVSQQAMRNVAKKNKHLVVVPIESGLHTLLFEADPQRLPVLSDIIKTTKATTLSTQ